MKPKIAIPDACGYDPQYSRKSLPPYIQAIETFGGEAIVIPLTLTPEDMARRIAQCSAVLLPGSKADVDPQKYGAVRHPKTAKADAARDAADELLLQDAYNLRKPVLGICYGLQSLNVWRTGTLVQDIESAVDHSPADKVGPAHQVTIEADSLLGHELGLRRGENVIQVNSSHHQSADKVGDGLRVVSRCNDDGIIEALEGTNPEHYVLAVQWHPERTYEGDQASRHLFAGFLQRAAAYQEKALKS